MKGSTCQTSPHNFRLYQVLDYKAQVRGADAFIARYIVVLSFVMDFKAIFISHNCALSKQVCAKTNSYFFDISLLQKT